jgi:hypothetical protein
MIEVIQWPPVQYCTYSLLGRRFEQEPDEPFVVKMRDGNVDTDLARQTPGFVNRIQRFGIQNKINRKEWSEENIYYSLLPKLPLELRPKYFRITQSDFQATHQKLMSATPHNAPVPAGLAEAAGFRGVAASDPDLPLQLAALTPEQWIGVLKKWVAADPVARKAKTVAGPCWWWSLHSVALNPNHKSTPQNFVGQWLGHFPCRRCRISARAYIGSHPYPDWAGFVAWANDFHNHVTNTK